MAKAVVVEIKCDRCKRKEYKEEAECGHEEPSLRMGGRLVPQADKGSGAVTLQDLCEPCQKTVAKYLEQIFKPMNSKSPKREKRAKKKGVVADPPSLPAS